ALGAFWRFSGLAEDRRIIQNAGLAFHRNNLGYTRRAFQQKRETPGPTLRFPLYELGLSYL
ncbi:MAG: hypothetical protein ACPL7K_07310, partial [Armatimonadota bacterium]